jgi:hypothetical protein
MKYVSRGPTGTFDLIGYEDYLKRERGVLAARMGGADLLTIDRFVPNGPGSFHDARFESLLVAASTAERPSSETPILRVELRLKGPYFDRYFELRYEDVASCSFQMPALTDDLLMHEVRMNDGLLAHEFLFDRGTTIVITCREMRFLEVENFLGVTC